MSTSDPRPATSPGHEPDRAASSPPPATSAPRPAAPAAPPPGPRTTGVGGHLLGVLAGLVLTVLALAVTALGMSRILADNGVGQETVVLNGLGVTLVAMGAVIAALVALLAVRTSAVPFTGGLVAMVLGAAYLFAPEGTHRETVRLLLTEQNSVGVLNTLTVLLIGVPFVVGLVLLASGTAASLVRRRGIAVGLHRERVRTGHPA